MWRNCVWISVAGRPWDGPGFKGSLDVLRVTKCLNSISQDSLKRGSFNDLSDLKEGVVAKRLGDWWGWTTKREEWSLKIQCELLKLFKMKIQACEEWVVLGVNLAIALNVGNVISCYVLVIVGLVTWRNGPLRVWESVECWDLQLDI